MWEIEVVHAVAVEVDVAMVWRWWQRVMCQYRA